MSTHTTTKQDGAYWLTAENGEALQRWVYLGRTKAEAEEALAQREALDAVLGREENGLAESCCYEGAV